jgi:tetratricopeptide (TPR) repeat protein
VAESQSLKPGAAQLEEARRQLIKLTEEVVGEFRATGDTYYANYQFEEALAAYKEGFGYVDKKDLPTLWATMQWVMGLANREIGIRTKDAAIREHLAEAVKAFGEALTIFKKSDFPEAWAAIENNLGIALRNQGTRTSGEAGTRLLAEAVAAYRAALTVRTKDQLPQQWAMTQNNLGKALLHLEDWRGAAEAYRNVLTLYPDYDEGYSSANALYHEKLFSYPEAFALSQQWLERHPDDLSAQANFAEAHFTTGRFADAEKRLTALLTNLRLDLSTGLGLRTLHVATLVALNKPESVPAALTTLRDFVAKVPADSEAGWSFEGSKHFIGSEPKLAPSRAWLLDLFSAVEEKDAQKRLAALEKVQADFPSMK